MGFHETRVTRPLLRNDLSDGDQVVLLRPDSESDSDRGQEAVAHVEDMLLEIAPGASVDVELIEHGSFETAVLQCCDVLEAAQGDLVVNFGGGAREIFLPLTIAAVLHAPSIEKTIQYTDIGQDLRSISLPNLCADVSPETVDTLRAIDDLGPDVSIPDLEEYLSTSKSTVSRHVGQLQTDELVETSTRGQTKHATITLGGRLHLRRLD